MPRKPWRAKVPADPIDDLAVMRAFAVMERLGIPCAASFDAHLAGYRCGRNRERAFGILS